MSSTLYFLIFTAIVAAVGVYYYNNLVNLRNRFVNAFSQIEVQLQRRFELIPNLVEIAASYMEHESETLRAVTEARNTASDRCSKAAANPSDAAAVGALASAEGVLNSAMGKFNMVMENYPELKADETMRDLHEELASTENRVAFSRQAYSDAVMVYNVAREQFPGNIVAGIFSFKPADLFKIEDKSMYEPVKVSFDRKRAA